MKAFVLRSYGSADRLRLEDVDRPEPGPDEVLIRVRATSVNPFDWHIMRGQPYVARLMGGPLGPRRPGFAILGADVAGVVEAVGRDVRDFHPGDEVYALTSGGGFAEYVRTKVANVAPKPARLSFEEAAAVPLAACTALIAVRDRGKWREPQEPGQGHGSGIMSAAMTDVRVNRFQDTRPEVGCQSDTINNVAEISAGKLFGSTRGEARQAGVL